MNNENMDDILKKDLYNICKTKSTETLYEWSKILTVHIINITLTNKLFLEEIDFLECVDWLEKKAIKSKAKEFKKQAKKERNNVNKNIFYVLYYSLLCSINKKYAYVLSDTCITIIECIHPNKKQEIINERIFQINSLNNM